MSLELEIKSLTAAVTALTAAVTGRVPAAAVAAPVAAAPAPAAPVAAVLAPPAAAPAMPGFTMPAPAAAAPAVPTLPFSDAKGMLAYLMSAYQTMGPAKGAGIQNVLTSLGVGNVNEVKPEQYAALVAGVEALRAAA